MAKKLIGREGERVLLEEALSSSEPELVAIWGRRRIGKTFLVRSCRPQAIRYFELTGVKEGKLKDQLFNFSKALSTSFYDGAPMEPPTSWGRAFALLSTAIDSLADPKRPVMLFFDEAPWLDSRKSGFLSALEYFWNSWGSDRDQVKLIVCGSSSSWILKKIVSGRGGWHRRVTRRIHLHPFTLAEAKEYLDSRNIRFSLADSIELYMALGGTAQYLKEIRRGESVAACLDRMCFQSQGPLRDEFDELFHSLFNAADLHVKIVTALAGTRSGMTKAQLRKNIRVGAGRQFTQAVENLCNADFVKTYLPFGETGGRSTRYRLADFFSLFHLRWMKSFRQKSGRWKPMHASAAYRSWAGFTFETLVWNHIDLLLRDVGLQNVPTETTKWRHFAEEEGDSGAEVDLLIDAGRTGLYLLELKHHDASYEITKAESSKLLGRRRALERATNSRRSIFVQMLATNGVVRNRYAEEAVDYIYDPKILFRRRGTN